MYKKKDTKAKYLLDIFRKPYYITPNVTLGCCCRGDNG